MRTLYMRLQNQKWFGNVCFTMCVGCAWDQLAENLVSVFGGVCYMC